MTGEGCRADVRKRDTDPHTSGWDEVEELRAEVERLRGRVRTFVAEVRRLPCWQDERGTWLDGVNRDELLREAEAIEGVRRGD